MPASLQPVEIAGGGLAGLSLGLALRRSGVPVTVFEAGVYPRHRVCGEFITGLSGCTIERLGLKPMFSGAQMYREVAWYLREQPLRRQPLPSPALGISRYRLDQRLADAFTAAGGELHTHARLPLDVAPAGRVFATGRRPARPEWVGLKCHALNPPLAAELELHLGEQAYVGLCAVEAGRVNLSGLFRLREGLGVSRELALSAYLRAAGLGALADRLTRVAIDPASYSAVAGLGFSAPSRRTDRLEIGDTYAMIPPFTGHGMAMAFQSAEQALDPLLVWSRGDAAWDETLRTVRCRLRRLFCVRLAVAAALHPVLVNPAGQRGLATASRLRVLPFDSLYRLTH
jgi:hypothetical protein